MAHHPAGGLADGDRAADTRPLVGRDGTTRLRNIDDPHGNVVPTGERQPARGVVRGNAAMAAIVDRAEEVAVGKPCELGRELVALARGGRDAHGKAVLELT